MAEDIPAVVPPAAEPWHKGADPELIGVLQARGLADKTAVEAVANLAKAHAEAEKLIGAPSNELVRWPKDANDTQNWTALRARLGVPGEAAGYDFSKIVNEKGEAVVDGKLADALRGAFHRLNVSAEAGVELAKTVAQINQDQAVASSAERAAKVQSEVQALKTSWGDQYDVNRTTAIGVLNAMLEKSGMSKEDAAGAINTLEAQVGGSKVMEMFRAFSQMAREDSTGWTPSNPAGGIQSYHEAVATKDALMRDEQFVSRWNRGDVEAIKQLSALNAVIVNNKPQSDEDLFRSQLATQGGRR